MQRLITGFRKDEVGDWVADLDCLHAQHVRHRPPFQQRPWVQSEDGRAARVGTTLNCPLCDRAEPPPGLTLSRTAGPFDQTSVPSGLRRTHRVPAHTWGCLRVEEGSVRFRMAAHPPIDREISAGDSQAIPPQVDHEVRLAGPVRLRVDFLTRP